MSETTQGEAKSGWRRRWPLIKKILTYVFFALVAGLLIGLARNLDWQEVYNTLRNYQAKTLWMAGAAAFGSYVVYCFFDVLGKRYARHDLPVRQILPVTFVCYAFNLNLSAWVGGIALRFRLYSRLGLEARADHPGVHREHPDQLAGLHVAGRTHLRHGLDRAAGQLEIGFTALRGRRWPVGGVRGVPGPVRLFQSAFVDHPRPRDPAAIAAPGADPAGPRGGQLVADGAGGSLHAVAAGGLSEVLGI